MLASTVIDTFGTLGVAGIIIAAVAITAIGVFISNLFDTSPTQDDRCRGGHDF